MAHKLAQETGGDPATLDRIIDERECHDITSLSRTTRWRLMRRGEFPKKVRLSANRTGWSHRSILDWIARRKVAA